MRQSRSTLVLARLVSYIVLAYGLIIIADSLLREVRGRHIHSFDPLLITVPQVTGLGFAYLGTLLMRRKYNAWLAALVLFSVTFLLNVVRIALAIHAADVIRPYHLILPVLMIVLLLTTRNVFQVRSDIRRLTRALWAASLILVIAFAYGVTGFLLLDEHDFHQEFTFIAAAHQTIDQFGLTTNQPVAYTRRARLFADSLSVISIAAIGYVALSLFDPIRVSLTSQDAQREHVRRLLLEYPSDIDDFFKLWPHDKSYYFDKSGEAGLAYHVSKGVALVVGDPFGDPKRFLLLCRSFQELCFVNDWRAVFLHISDRHRTLYEKLGFRLQKLGEEAIVDISAFQEHNSDKYFRQIRNRYDKLGFRTEFLEPPHPANVLASLAKISANWLARPGRAERQLTMGFYSAAYMQQSKIVIARDEKGSIQGFINVVPTFEVGMANYDMLRCKSDAPGNCNDFLLLSLIAMLHDQGYTKLNLGLSPLRGVGEGSEEATAIDVALRFVYANGDRFFSFSGLQRFKAKYYPTWENRYVAYHGNAASFARAMTALTRAMKVK